MDLTRIRSATPAELGSYYKILSREGDVDATTQELLDAIKCDSLAPSAFAPWLHVSKSPLAIQAALKQNFSISIRHHGINQFRRQIRSAQWKDTWDGMGGTQGLLDIFGDLSPVEVKHACRALQRCGFGADLEEKRRCLTELFKALHPHIYPDAAYRTTDKRPLTKYYLYLTPACSEEIAKAYLEKRFDGPWEPLRDGTVERFHADLAQQDQLERLIHDKGKSKNHRILAGLFHQWPGTSGQEPRISASMEYSIKILRTVTEQNTSELGHGFIIDDLVRPLLRRAIKKKIAWPKMKEIGDLIMQYLERYPDAGKELYADKNDIPHLVAMCWARKPHIFEKLLKSLLCNPHSEIVGTKDFETWEVILEGVLRRRRYALLRLCFLESAKLDIDDDEDLKKCEGSISNRLLMEMDAGDALSLFQRLRKNRGDVDLVKTDTYGSILNVNCGTDPHVFHIYLQYRSGNHKEAARLATELGAISREKAFLASEAEARALHANTVLNYTIACGSLLVYEEAMNWCRRFQRDPLLIHEIYRSFPTEVRQLLSGIPVSLDSTMDISMIRGRAEIGNRIIAQLFDTMCLLLREPSFRGDTWFGVQQLFVSVVKERMKQSGALQKSLAASDAQIYSALWEDTLDMIIKVEEKANQGPYEKLNADSLYGPFQSRYGYVNDPAAPEPMDSASYSFIDNLAKARDELWRKLREVKRPAVVSLPPAYPRGLSLQYLVQPWRIKLHNLDRNMPYISSRVKSCLFPDPKEALQPVPTDEELRRVIGRFTDTYVDALELYIPKSLAEDEKNKRVEEVWRYATGPLSEGRMDLEEAERFWRPIFWTVASELRSWKPRKYLNKARPLVPKPSSSLEPQSWNPFLTREPRFRGRKLVDITFIDLSLADRSDLYGTPTIRDPMNPPKEVEIPADQNKGNSASIWHSGGDGCVLSAMLYIETRYVESAFGLLSVPFPGPENARYPALYLTKDFLKCEELSPPSAVKAIDTHIGDVPTTLLHRLASSMWSKNASWHHGETEQLDPTALQVAMEIVVALVDSDRPALGSDLAVRTVVEQRDASSWHRRLLKQSLFRRMSASDSRKCIEKFASEMIAMLQNGKDKDSSTSSDSVEDEGGQTPKYAKVTTLKQLAQLLRGSDFIEEDATFILIGDLLRNSSHIDVRLSGLKVLLDMVETASSELSGKALDAIESVLPPLANLNERRPLTEEYWEHCEACNEVPELLEYSLDSTALSIMIDHFFNSSNEPLRLQAYVDRVLLPMIDTLKKQMARWNTLFLQHHHAGNDIRVPPVPRDPRYIISLFKKDSKLLAYLPASLLEDHVSYMLFNISGSSIVQKFTKKLRSDPTLMPREDVKTWLNLYDQDVLIVTHFGYLDLLSHLGTVTKLDLSVGITLKVLRECYLRIFEALIWADAPSYTTRRSRFFQPLLQCKYLNEPWWESEGKSILSAMIAVVENMRTQEWECEPDRRPALLPDTFPWSLLLLDYPWPSHDDTEDVVENKCREFAARLSLVIAGISGLVYHHKLQQIKSYLVLEPAQNRSIKSQVSMFDTWSAELEDLRQMHVQRRILIAIYIGELKVARESQMTTPQLLSVELAQHLFCYTDDWKSCVEKQLHDRVRTRIQEWKGCENESVRRMGYEIWGKYFVEGKAQGNHGSWR